MLLGLDLGTGSLKALLLSEAGAVVRHTSVSYPVHAPHPGWAETPPQAWWEAACRAVREVVAGDAGAVRGVGLSGQMHGVVLLGASGAVLRPAVLWADTRSSPLLGRYREAVAAAGAASALKNPVTAGMAGPTLLWLRALEPDVAAQTRWALQPKDWLRYRLTGEVASEPSDASGTLLFDVARGGWLTGLMERLEFPPTWFPPLVPSASVAGHVTREAAAALGLRAGLPVVAGGADTACAALGSGLSAPGAAQLTVGTGAQIIALQSHPQAAPERGVHLYRTVHSTVHGGPEAGGAAPFYALAAVQNGGLALEWARAALGLSWEALYAAAFAAPPGSDGLTFAPYLSGERTPHLDAEVRGSWLGVSLQHTPGHLARAALEGVAFALRDALTALLPDASAPLQLAGGGTTDPRWQQLLADVLGRPLRPTDTPAASARGAALLAALGTGALSGADLTALSSPRAAPLHPTPDARLEAAYQRFRAAYPLLHAWSAR